MNENDEEHKTKEKIVCNGVDRPAKEWNVKRSHLARKTINPIRRIVDQMVLTPNPKKQMIALSIGDPCVFGNLSPPEEAKEAVIEVIRNNKCNGYAPATGYENSRQAIAEYSACEGHNPTSKDIVITSGCSSALELCILGIANPGDNILLPCPGFSIYGTYANSCDIEPRYYDLDPSTNWEIDLNHMESLIDHKTSLLLINNPSNPCGSVFSKQHLLDILKIAEKHKLVIVADEIYAHFVFDGQTFIALASLTQTVPILSCGGLTKRFLVPGWRMGWIVVYDKQNYLKEVREGLNSLATRILGANTLVQGAVRTILESTPPSFFINTIQLIQSNAAIAFDAINAAPGLTPIKPQGAMYMMIRINIQHFPDFENDMSFTERMVTEQSVFCLPGKCFEFPNYFRIVLTVPREMVTEACVRITEFCYDHYCSL